MPPEIVTDKHIVVKRQIVIGSGAEIVPEAAPANAVRVREEEIDVNLQRYGADIEMNTNLLAMPDQYAAELQMKMDFQNAAMSARLVELGFETILGTCSLLPNLLVSNNPAMNGANDIDRAHAIDANSARLFGALQKYSSGVNTLLAMCKRASAAPFDTLIIPSGTHELMNFSLVDSVRYNVTGIRDTDRRIEFGLDSIRIDPVSGLRIGVSRGTSSFAHGTNAPQARPGCLSRTVTFAVVVPNYKAGTNLFVDYKQNAAKSAADLYAQHRDSGQVNLTNEGAFIQLVTCVVSSAVIGVAGSGHLAIGYPTTSTHTVPTSPELTKIQLRTYLGAYVTNPESIVICPDVFIEGVTSIKSYELNRVETVTAAAPSGGTETVKIEFMAGSGLPTLGGDMDTVGRARAVNKVFTAQDNLAASAVANTTAGVPITTGNKDINDQMEVIVNGEKYTAYLPSLLNSATRKVVVPNKGHLGSLDRLDGIGALVAGFPMVPAGRD